MAPVWPPCCTTLHDVERNLISIKHRLQHHPTFLLFSGVYKNVTLVWAPSSTLLNACMPTKQTFFGQDSTARVSFLRVLGSFWTQTALFFKSNRTCPPLNVPPHHKTKQTFFQWQTPKSRRKVVLFSSLTF